MITRDTWPRLARCESGSCGCTGGVETPDIQCTLTPGKNSRYALCHQHGKYRGKCCPVCHMYGVTMGAPIWEIDWKGSGKMSIKVATSEVLIARDLLLEQAKLSKDMLVAEINSGQRDWSKMRNMLERYQDLQTGADALGHTCHIEDRA